MALDRINTAVLYKFDLCRIVGYSYSFASEIKFIDLMRISDRLKYCDVRIDCELGEDNLAQIYFVD